jgi:hypothetical protein
MVAVELVGFFFWYIKNIPMKGWYKWKWK